MKYIISLCTSFVSQCEGVNGGGGGGGGGRRGRYCDF